MNCSVEIEDRQDCAIFELCDGGDLAQYVDNHGPLSLAHTKRWSRGMTQFYFKGQRHSHGLRIVTDRKRCF